MKRAFPVGFLFLVSLVFCLEKPANAQLQPSSPKISVGGIVSSCRQGIHQIDQISQNCGSYPDRAAYETVPGEYLEIYGSNLAPQNGETLQVKFTQYSASKSNVKVVYDNSSNIGVGSDNQVNVKVPTGLFSGPTFISLIYSGRGATNADMINIIGPRYFLGHKISQSNFKLQLGLGNL